MKSLTANGSITLRSYAQAQTTPLNCLVHCYGQEYHRLPCIVPRDYPSQRALIWILYTRVGIMHGGYDLWQGKKEEKDSQHLQCFNSGNEHFTLENKNYP